MGQKVMNRGIWRFLTDITERNVNLHSVLLMRRQKILAQWYNKPYGPNTLHRMYSVTKSLTSIAIGLLAEEGKLHLTDRICQYFPEYLPSESVHPWLWETRIEDLLTMRSCHSRAAYKQMTTDRWVASFFQAKPDHCPGTVFSYDTSASVVLAALTERLSGMELLSYLRKKALREIGISEQAYILKTPDGVSDGGSGLMCTTEDLAKIGDLCCHFGRAGGRWLLPETYMRRAVACQTGTPLQPVTDERQGYGYQFWMARHGGFVMYGMGGQLALCFPKKELTFVTTGYTAGDPAGVQSIFDAFYKNIYPGTTLYGTVRFCGSRVSASPIFSCRKKKLVIDFQENAAGWKWAHLLWQGESGCLDYENGRGRWTIPFQRAGKRCKLLRFFMENDSKSPSWAFLHGREQGFFLQVEQAGEEPGTLWIEAGIRGRNITLHMKQNGNPAFGDYSGFLNGFLFNEILTENEEGGERRESDTDILGRGFHGKIQPD